MGTLGRRLDRLEVLARPDICPEHERGRGAGPDWRERFFASLRAMSPNPAERAAYHAEQDRLEAQPGCPRCGWKDAPAFRIVARDDWGWAAGMGAHDEPA